MTIVKNLWIGLLKWLETTMRPVPTPRAVWDEMRLHTKGCFWVWWLKWLGLRRSCQVARDSALLERRVSDWLSDRMAEHSREDPDWGRPVGVPENGAPTRRNSHNPRCESGGSSDDSQLLVHDRSGRSDQRSFKIWRTCLVPSKHTHIYIYI